MSNVDRDLSAGGAAPARDGVSPVDDLLEFAAVTAALPELPAAFNPDALLRSDPAPALVPGPEPAFAPGLDPDPIGALLGDPRVDGTPRPDPPAPAKRAVPGVAGDFIPFLPDELLPAIVDAFAAEDEALLATVVLPAWPAAVFDAPRWIPDAGDLPGAEPTWELVPAVPSAHALAPPARFIEIEDGDDDPSRPLVALGVAALLPLARSDDAVVSVLGVGEPMMWSVRDAFDLEWSLGRDCPRALALSAELGPGGQLVLLEAACAQREPWLGDPSSVPAELVDAIARAFGVLGERTPVVAEGLRSHLALRLWFAQCAVYSEAALGVVPEPARFVRELAALVVAVRPSAPDALAWRIPAFAVLDRLGEAADQLAWLAAGVAGDRGDAEVAFAHALARHDATASVRDVCVDLLCALGLERVLERGVLDAVVAAAWHAVVVAAGSPQALVDRLAEGHGAAERVLKASPSAWTEADVRTFLDSEPAVEPSAEIAALWAAHDVACRGDVVRVDPDRVRRVALSARAHRDLVVRTADRARLLRARVSDGAGSASAEPVWTLDASAVFTRLAPLATACGVTFSDTPELAVVPLDATPGQRCVAALAYLSRRVRSATFADPDLDVLDRDVLPLLRTALGEGEEVLGGDQSALLQALVSWISGVVAAAPAVGGGVALDVARAVAARFEALHGELDVSLHGSAPAVRVVVRMVHAALVRFVDPERRVDALESFFARLLDEGAALTPGLRLAAHAVVFSAPVLVDATRRLVRRLGALETAPRGADRLLGALDEALLARCDEVDRGVLVDALVELRACRRRLGGAGG